MIQPLPKVSVVCAWYNRADYVHDTVVSLLAQDYGNFDITIVNDGSPDPRVRAILDSYTDPRLRVIHQDNTGFTLAIRRAIEESEGEYIAIQGAGDISLPGRLSAQSNYLSQNSEVAVSGCYYFDVEVSDSGEEIRRRSVENSNAGSLKSVLNANVFSHGETMFRRSVYFKTGGYRTLFVNAQDRDLWLRMVEFGALGVVESYLYERRQFKNDGVSTSVNKTMRQIILSEYSKYSAVQRDICGSDPIDVLDIHALACMPKSRRVMYALIFFSLVEQENHGENFKLYGSMARKYSLTSHVLCIAVFDLNIGKLILEIDRWLENAGRGFGLWRRFQRFLSA